MNDCLFCKIARHEIPAKIMLENENIVVFDDINPKATIHKLIIPKKHIATINDLENDDQEIIAEMILTAKKIAKDLGVDQSGYRLIFNCNKAAGQEVFHIHLHFLAGKILPKF